MRRAVLPSILLVVAACVLCLAASVAGSSVHAAATTGSDDDVQVLGPGAQEGARRQLGDLIGRLHPALVHFPIAGLVALAGVDFLGLVLRRTGWARAGIVLLVATTISALPTVGTGLLRGHYMAMDMEEHALLVKHRTLNLVVLGLLVAALAIRAVRGHALRGSGRIVYLVLIAVATGLILVAASFGGQMVYGPDYLPF